MINDWTIAHNYAVQTGDCEYAKAYVKPETDEEKFYGYVERLYKRGGWVIDGIEKFTADGSPWSEDGETYFWKAYRGWNQEIHVEPSGKWTAWDNDDKTNDTFKFEMKHNGKKWEIINCEEVDD